METKNDKEPFSLPVTKSKTRPVALESAEKPKLPSQPQLQPQPPSSPAHSESRRSGGKGDRGVKRSLKNKPAVDKAPAESTEVKSGTGEVSIKTSKPLNVTRSDQPPLEPSAKRTTARLSKTTKDVTSLVNRDTQSVKSTVANVKTPHAHPLSGRSPQTQCRDGDIAERLDNGQEHKPGAAVTAASHTIKTQVRIVEVPIYS